MINFLKGLTCHEGYHFKKNKFKEPIEEKIKIKENSYILTNIKMINLTNKKILFWSHIFFLLSSF